jgi:hypothetical protein
MGQTHNRDVVQRNHQDNRSCISEMTDETPVSLRCELATLHQSAHGSITANLEVRIGEFVFPGPGWSDFVAIILGWWLEALHTLLRGEQSVELRFMDGRYVMWLTREGQNHYILKCREEREEHTVVFQAGVNPAQLLSATERTAADVIKACAAKKLEAAPLRSLSSLLNDRRYRAPLH